VQENARPRAGVCLMPWAVTCERPGTPIYGGMRAGPRSPAFAESRPQDSRPHVDGQVVLHGIAARREDPRKGISRPDRQYR